MKKLIALIAAGFALAANLSAEIPTFDDVRAFVIDSTKIPGTIKDNVKVTNVSSSAANFDLTVYAYDEEAKNWIVFGKGHLKGLSDTDTIKSLNKKQIKLANYKYFAIRSTVDNPFKYSVAKAANDLKVWIYDDKVIDESHFKVFDITMLPEFADNLKIVGGENLTSAASFRILAYNDENEEKKSGTIAILKGAKASDIYKTTSKGEKFNKFHYIKIISREEKDFRYTANVDHNDLIITVSEK